MKKYLRSEKGIATRKRYIAEHREDELVYHRKYSKIRRDECRKKKICIKCFKNDAEHGVLCERCSKRQYMYQHKDNGRV